MSAIFGEVLQKCKFECEYQCEALQICRCECKYACKALQKCEASQFEALNLIFRRGLVRIYKYIHRHSFSNLRGEITLKHLLLLTHRHLTYTSQRICPVMIGDFVPKIHNCPAFLYFHTVLCGECSVGSYMNFIMAIL